MNLFACLGVGPGNQLLLGPMTPGLEYRSPTEWRLFEPPAPREPRVVRVRRSQAESDAMRERVVRALKRGEAPADIAAREGISRPYVQWIKATRKTDRRTYRTKAQNDALVAKAQRLMADFPSIKQREVAAQCGITESNLSNLLARRAGRRT